MNDEPMELDPDDQAAVAVYREAYALFHAIFRTPYEGDLPEEVIDAGTKFDRLFGLIDANKFERPQDFAALLQAGYDVADKRQSRF